ncbi:unnamed protein product [Prorocentrum cordatum]|uniref:Uncharacterized protein n=1 Tax=Prorocentrum cordatum TaxID=2364126 RepID=A0ABN9U348_9DINO|nr:unnamed protein product [Polarella glacialis]
MPKVNHRRGGGGDAGKHISSFEEVKARNSGKLSAYDKARAIRNGDTVEAESDEEEPQQAVQKPRGQSGVQGLIATENPNAVKRDEVKEGVELSRKQREEIERQAARRRYEELHKDVKKQVNKKGGKGVKDPGQGRLRATGRELGAQAAPIAAALCREALAATGAGAGARLHYAEVLGEGAEGAAVLLHRRRWLLEVDEATRFSQWRTETAVARLMNGVSVDAGDLFAALKRAFLASQVACLADGKGVAQWMHVLGAVEEPTAGPRAGPGAGGRGVEGAGAGAGGGETLIWAVQTAHFVEALPELAGWLLVAGGPSEERLRGWLRRLEARLRKEPLLGRYGPAGDSSQVRARHLAQILPAAVGAV